MNEGNYHPNELPDATRVLDSVQSRVATGVLHAWPSHAWSVALAPYEDPEFAVIAFVYNGSEGAVVSGPIVKQVLESCFHQKAIDAARQS